MKNFYKILLLLISAINISSGQQTRLDSIKTELNSFNKEARVNYIVSIPEDKFLQYPKFMEELYFEGILLAEELDYTKGVILLKKRLGILCRIQGRYVKSLGHYFSALKIAEGFDDIKIISNIQNEIGHVYNYLANFNSALEYYRLSQQNRILINDSLGIAATYNNIGNIYKSLKNYELSLDNLTEALSMYHKLRSSAKAIPTLMNLGNVTRLLTKYDLSEEYYDEALLYAQQENNQFRIAVIKNRLGKLYIDTGNLEDAQTIVNEAYQYLITRNIPHSLMESCNLLSDIYSLQNKYRLANEYYKKYDTLRDSIYTNQISKTAAELESVYDTQSKEKEIQRLEIQKQTYIRNIFIIISIALILLATLLFFRVKERNRIAKEIEKKNIDLQLAIEKAEKANQLKFEFLAQMSHEIRTPINVLLSFSSLIRDELSDVINQDMHDSFSSMVRAGRRIVRTVDLLLNMSELQTGTYESETKIIDLRKEVLTPIYEEYKALAADKNLEFLYIDNVKNSLVLADEYTLEQIFYNLIDNAIKYTIVGKVEIILNEENRQLSVCIQDTGIGISEEYQKKIFDPFTQEQQGYTRQFEGNGLGLALVQRYCNLNNIEIELTSEKDKGSCFKVVFPRKPD